MRRIILAGVCVLAIATAPTAAAEPTGDNTNFAPYGEGVPVVMSGRPVPTMNGVPCVGGHLGTCISMAQNQPPPRRPSTGVGHTPTIRN